jgi:hypothetical protein
MVVKSSDTRIGCPPRTAAVWPLMLTSPDRPAVIPATVRSCSMSSTNCSRRSQESGAGLMVVFFGVGRPGLRGGHATRRGLHHRTRHFASRGRVGTGGSGGVIQGGVFPLLSPGPVDHPSSRTLELVHRMSIARSWKLPNWRDDCDRPGQVFGSAEVLVEPCSLEISSLLLCQKCNRCW